MVAALRYLSNRTLQLLTTLILKAGVDILTLHYSEQKPTVITGFKQLFANVLYEVHVYLLKLLVKRQTIFCTILMKKLIKNIEIKQMQSN